MRMVHRLILNYPVQTGEPGGPCYSRVPSYIAGPGREAAPSPATTPAPLPAQPRQSLLKSNNPGSGLGEEAGRRGRGSSSETEECKGRGSSRGRSRSRSRYRSRRAGQVVGGGERSRQVEERRVVYAGGIEEGTLKADLRARFQVGTSHQLPWKVSLVLSPLLRTARAQVFGPIEDISLHFRDRGDNYGFVTFQHRADAYTAVERGNQDGSQPRWGRNSTE